MRCRGWIVPDAVDGDEMLGIPGSGPWYCGNILRLLMGNEARYSASVYQDLKIVSKSLT